MSEYSGRWSASAPREPGRLEIAWLELERRPAVGDEGPLAVGRDEDADPPRASARDPDDSRGHAVAADRLDERPARCVPPDRRDERRTRPEPPEPASRSRGRPTLDEEDPAGDVGPMLERPFRLEHDVDDEIAEDHDPRPR